MGARELSALEVQRLTKPGRHSVGGVSGLALQVQGEDRGFTRSWVLRVMVGGKRREMGLGGFPDVPLADARRRARDVREQLDSGIDPIAQRRKAQSKLVAELAAAKTFRQCATAYIEAHEAGWRNAKHGQQWRNTLETYAYPVMGDVLVAEVTKELVLDVLKPIWTTKPETASRVRGRIELVLSYAMQAGYRPESLNPARWKGGLDKLLPAPTKVAKVTHHPAMPIGQAGAFMQWLRGQDGMGARALEFAVLTAARSGEVRGMTWTEVDLADKTWTVPAGRMKAGREHRVPLSIAAMAVLERVPAGEPDDLVFPAPRGGQLSDMTLTAVMRRKGESAVPHGFRSTFRDWVAERTSYPGDMAELALAHAVGDKVEAAYRRGDQFERRRELMQAWADFLARPEPAKSGRVTSIGARRAA